MKENPQPDSEETRRLKAIFENSVDGIITIDDKGIVESLNPAAAQLFGYQPAEVTGNNIKMLMPEPYHSEHDGYLKNYHGTGTKKIIGIGREVMGRKKNGTHFPFFLSVSEVLLDKRKIFTGIIHDISELKSIEKSVQVEKNRLTAIFDTVVDGIVIIDEKGCIQRINPAVNKLFGYTTEEMLGQNVKMLMPEPHVSGHDQYLQNYHSSQNAQIIGIGREVEGKRKDGSTFPFFLSVSEVQFEDYKLFTGIIHDITELKQKEHELEESKNKLAAIFETAVNGIIIIDNRGAIEMINPAVTKLFQYTEEECIGKNVRFLMPEPHHTDHDQYLKNYQSSRTAKIIGIGREVQGKRKDGTLFPFNLGVSEVKLEGKILYTGIIHDLSKQKETELEIRKLNESLEQEVGKRTEELSETVNKLIKTNNKLGVEIGERKQIQQALIDSETELRQALEKEKELGDLKSRFISMASHEFRTPLSTILSSVYLIEQYAAEDQQQKRKKHIDRIVSSVNNLTGILNDFLSLSKLEEGKIENNPETFIIGDLCTEVSDDLEGLLKEGQEISHKIESSLKVNADKRILKNVLFNLLSNAIKYSPPNSLIKCKVEKSNNFIVIEVKDEGIGIPKADQTHLFSRFFRATNVTNIQGTGLGLNIVKRYIDLMNGSISFESEENNGTTFTVQIPQ